MLPIVAVHFRCLRWETGAERAVQCDVCSFDIFARVVFGVRDAYFKKVMLFFVLNIIQRYNLHFITKSSFHSVLIPPYAACLLHSFSFTHPLATAVTLQCRQSLD